MSSSQVTHADPDTGPILVSLADGLSTRQIASRLHISQTTAARKVKAIRDGVAELDLTRKVQLAQMAMFAVVSMCAVVVTAAVATIAW